MKVNFIEIGMYVGIVSGMIHATAYCIYNWHKATKPNIAAWGIWGFLTILNTSSYFVMSADWAKSLLTIANSFFCILTLILAFSRGKIERLDIWDRIALIIGIFAGAVWWRWQSATYANLVLQGAISVGFIPLYRGVWHNPSRERALPWLVWTVGYCVNILAVVLRWKGQWQDLAYPVNSILFHSGVAILVSLRLSKIRKMVELSEIMEFVLLDHDWSRNRCTPKGARYDHLQNRGYVRKAFVFILSKKNKNKELSDYEKAFLREHIDLIH